MGQKAAIIQQLSQFKKRVSKQIPIQQLIFFGSRARGRGKKYSDIDLIVISSYFRRLSYARGKNLYDYWTLDYPVDFLCYTPEEFKKLKNQISIVRHALEEGIEIT